MISDTRLNIIGEMTNRMLNLPDTLAGMTVLAPTPLNAPSMPCKDKLGFRILPISTSTLSEDRAMGAPADSSTSWIE